MNNKKVLVIDDDDGVREVIQICLEAVAGWDIVTADSGREGIVVAELHQPDAILLDVMMPLMDGTETFKQLQKNEKTRHIPTILLTAKAKMSEQKQFKDLGVTGVITKPFDPQNLVEQIKLILNW
ncbi:MAG: response regulator [Xenococcaceae cyanobacterium]